VNPEDKFCSQIEELSDSLKEGDVLLSNHPSAGGTHLPDLTVITPVSCPRPLPNPNVYQLFFLYRHRDHHHYSLCQ